MSDIEQGGRSRHFYPRHCALSKLVTPFDSQTLWRSRDEGHLPFWGCVLSPTSGSLRVPPKMIVQH